MDWFLYDNSLRHERVNHVREKMSKNGGPYFNRVYVVIPSYIELPWLNLHVDFNHKFLLEQRDWYEKNCYIQGALF